MSETQNVQEEKAQGKFPLKAVLGQKVGMTQIYTTAGECIPVTAVYTGTCVTTDVRTREQHGYEAVQMGVGEQKEKSLNHVEKSWFSKKNMAPVRWLKEFRIHDPKKIEEFRSLIGQKVPLTMFASGDYVDVSGITKGKGFAGVIKRHGFHGLPSSHGASVKERSRGSSGGGSGEPQRVLKGSRMAGRMGGDWVKVQKLEVVKVDQENDILLIKGAVPGTPESLVIVEETTKAVKHRAASHGDKASKKTSKKVAKGPQKGK